MENSNHIKFFSIGSGSSGNCYYLAYKNTSILIDAGLRGRIVANVLSEYQIDTKSLDAIIITHDHADHVRGVGSLAVYNNLPIYATNPVAESLLNSRFIQEDLSGYIRQIVCGESFTIKDLTINTFKVPHDSLDNVGYTIYTEAGTLSLITDIGHINEDIQKAIANSNFLVLESNYDLEMLKSGRYPLFLKNRITSGFGHISNIDSAESLAKNYHLNLKFVGLCHLSKDNNHPELAYKCFDQRLFEEGIRVGKDLLLHVFKRSTPSPIFYLNKYFPLDSYLST